MRLFIAVEFPESLLNELEENIRSLRGAFDSARFSRRENLHITLVFLGEAPPSRVKDITRAMDSCSGMPFTLKIGRLGRFKRAGGDILWRSIQAPDILYQVQETLSAQLRLAGFSLEDRPFKPHLTLARAAVLAPGQQLEALSRNYPPLECTVQGMTLMRSERIQGKLTYTALHRTIWKNPD